jgi:hypothetical protein
VQEARESNDKPLIFVSIFMNTVVFLSLSLSLWLYSPLDLGRFFSFLILYTVGRTPWKGDQPVARAVPAHDKTNTECVYVSMYV